LSLLSFFFYSSSDYRDLHSFPTRRSSDLFRNIRYIFENDIDSFHFMLLIYAVLVATLVGFMLLERSRFGVIFRMITPKRERSSRSEEHTSELQSLTNLVCRLLLEKKNTRK